MFVQIIEGVVGDRDRFEAQLRRWRSDVRPGAVGFLGSTGGVTDDGVAFIAARFESAQAAKENSDRPEQSAWWAETAPAFEGEIEFMDCTEVDLLMGGGSERAGFVQVMEGRAKDPAQMRAGAAAMEAEIRSSRPDVLGAMVAWHTDRGFTQVVYFSSEAEARAAETASAGAPDDAWADLLDGPLAYLDLRHPEFD